MRVAGGTLVAGQGVEPARRRSCSTADVDLIRAPSRSPRRSNSTRTVTAMAPVAARAAGIDPSTSSTGRPDSVASCPRAPPEVITIERAPVPSAPRSASTVSSSSPPWEIATTSAPDPAKAGHS
jgi:hypothetical protein